MTEDFKSLAKIIAFYDPLLCRYARILTGNLVMARIFVKKVLEDQYDIDKLEPSPHLRKQLKMKLEYLCLTWKQLIETGGKSHNVASAELKHYLQDQHQHKQ